MIGTSDLTAELGAPDVLAYNAADDWRLVLDLTEHRLNAAKETPAQIAILMEAAKISETRAQDADAAFALTRRALLLDPSDPTNETITELFRLADRAGLLANPEVATRRMKAVLATRGIEA